MKKLKIFAIIFALIISFTACQDKASAFDEQYDLGIKYLTDGNYEEAIIAFEAAIEIDSKNPNAYIKLADVYIEMGDEDRAREVLEEGLEANPENQKILVKLKRLDNGEDSQWGKFYNLGKQMYIEEKYDKAITALEKAIEADPSKDDAYVLLAKIYISLGENDKAIEIVEQGLSACGETDKLKQLYDELDVFDPADYFNADESGVKILDVKFDEESFLANNPTEFTVTAAYKCPDDKEYYLALKFNDDCVKFSLQQVTVKST